MDEQKRMAILIVRTLVLLAALLSGCATIESVAPYERGYLSEVGMAWEAGKRNEKLEGHVYTSKEASSGGASAAGGGCGCN